VVADNALEERGKRRGKAVEAYLRGTYQDGILGEASWISYTCERGYALCHEIMQLVCRRRRPFWRGSYQATGLTPLRHSVTWLTVSGLPHI
jgi:hypothetical protein